MKPLRHRLRLRIALVAMLALLWSQTALAWHVACAMASPPLPVAVQPMQMGGHTAHCHDTPAPVSNSHGMCAAHCDQAVPSPDTARIPALPALTALVPSLAIAWVSPAQATLRRVDSPPAIPWHRPTAHPAALLLI